MIQHQSGGTVAEAIEGLTHDAAFRAWLTDTVKAAPFEALRWETPPVTPTTLDRAFEFVLLDAPSLARRPDRDAFAAHYRPETNAVAFSSLGGDAMLIAPCPVAAPPVYVHLASFLRGAPPTQIDALWQRVGVELSARIARDRAPVWMSTAGDGVAWLHVRLDDRPKYYHHRPYTRST